MLQSLGRPRRGVRTNEVCIVVARWLFYRRNTVSPRTPRHFDQPPRPVPFQVLGACHGFMISLSRASLTFFLTAYEDIRCTLRRYISAALLGRHGGAPSTPMDNLTEEHEEIRG
jgi:hypothetical protein